MRVRHRLKPILRTASSVQPTCVFMHYGAFSSIPAEGRRPRNAGRTFREPNWPDSSDRVCHLNFVRYGPHAAPCTVTRISRRGRLYSRIPSVPSTRDQVCILTYALWCGRRKLRATRTRGTISAGVYDILGNLVCRLCRSLAFKDKPRGCTSQILRATSGDETRPGSAV